MRFRRKLYARGSSYETTIPKPLLFALDPAKKHDVLFEHDPATGRWYVAFEERVRSGGARTPAAQAKEAAELLDAAPAADNAVDALLGGIAPGMAPGMSAKAQRKPTAGRRPRISANDSSTDDGRIAFAAQETERDRDV